MCFYKDTSLPRSLKVEQKILVLLAPERYRAGQLGFNYLNMQYSGWIISYHDMKTKERFFKGPFCMCDLAQDCARKLKKQYTAVKIYHLVYEECDQV